MLNDLELYALKALVDRFLAHHGEKMEREIPEGYLALKSVQTKLHRAKPFRPQVHAH